MAARFRVYEFDGDTPVREVTLEHPDIEQIEWEVHLANTKATKAFLNSRNTEREDLAIDTGPVKISGKDKSKVLNGELGVTIPKNRIRLGDLKSDAAGRLLVLGGHGDSRDLEQLFQFEIIQNSGWFDDTSDGRVKARIKVVQRGVS